MLGLVRCVCNGGLSLPKVYLKRRSRRVHAWLGRGGGQMHKCSSCGYVRAAVAEFPDDALKKLQRAERMRAKFRERKPLKY